MDFQYKPSMTQTERQLLLGWGEDVFHSEPLQLIWRPKELHLIGYLDGIPVSKCGLLTQTIRVGEQSLLVGGVGGVVTPPDQQGRGHASAILQEALRFLRDEWQVAAAVLFCREQLVPFYCARGWQPVPGPVTIAQPDGPIAAPVPALYYWLADGGWPAGEVDLDSLPW